MIMGLLWLIAALPGSAQTFAEWFRQNSTRLKYYAQQITALQVYLGELQKGYDISNAGLGTISTSKQGEYELQNTFYASLGEINPALGQLDEVGQIVALQAAIIRRFTDALERYRRDGLIGADRLAYMEQVYVKVLQAGLVDVEILTEVLTAGGWQMTDDQRIARIRELDLAMRDGYVFSLAFTDRADMLERQQAVEAADVGSVEALYGVP